MILVEELFDYTAQKLNGLTGGTGFTAAWVASATGTSGWPAVQAGNLTYAGISNGTPANDGKLYARNAGYSSSIQTTFSRAFNAIPNTVNGAVYWLAFTIASNTAKNNSAIWLNKLTSDIAGNNPQDLLLWTSANVDANVICNGNILYTGSVSYVPHNVVIKITMSGSSSVAVRVDVYADVDMNTNPSGWTPKATSTSWYVPSDITALHFDCRTSATTGGDDQLYMDNIRWATTSYEAGGYAVPSSGDTAGDFFQFF